MATTKPVQKQEINIEGLRSICQEHLDDFENGHNDHNDQHMIYEAAMETFFEKESLWNYINEKCDEFPDDNL